MMKIVWLIVTCAVFGALGGWLLALGGWPWVSLNSGVALGLTVVALGTYRLAEWADTRRESQR